GRAKQATTSVLPETRSGQRSSIQLPNLNARTPKRSALGRVKAERRPPPNWRTSRRLGEGPTTSTAKPGEMVGGARADFHKPEPGPGPRGPVRSSAALLRPERGPQAAAW